MEHELSRDDCVGLIPEWKDLNPQTESLSGGITNFAEEIVADGYGSDAAEAVKQAGLPFFRRLPSLTLTSELGKKL